MADSMTRGDCSESTPLTCRPLGSAGEECSPMDFCSSMGSTVSALSHVMRFVAVAAGGVGAVAGVKGVPVSA